MQPPHPDAPAVLAAKLATLDRYIADWSAHGEVGRFEWCRDPAKPAGWSAPWLAETRGSWYHASIIRHLIERGVRYRADDEGVTVLCESSV